MKTIKLLSTLVLMITVLIANGQKTPKEITDEFFRVYPNMPSSAIKTAFMNICSPKTEEQEVALVKKAEQFMDLYGWYKSHEQIAEETTGESVKVFTYLVKYDCQPIKLTLVLYKAKEDWRISNIYIDNFGKD